jgi:glycosyltransferase involved in cell wall biosynthesis
MIDHVLTQNRIDADALHAAYNRYIVGNRYTDARRLLDDLQDRFPSNRQVNQLSIALWLQQSNPIQAMREIQSLVSCCTPDDGLIDAALAVRDKISKQSRPLSKASCPTISLCMVVKNESASIGACLNSVKPLVDEIVLVDTGSVDRTKDIARIFGTHVLDYPWNNDFAAARNYGLERANCDWVLILDADEIIAADDHDKIRDLVKQAESKRMAFNIETRNYTHLVNTFGWRANDDTYQNCLAGNGWYPTRKVRLFPRIPGIRFRFPVHERVDPTIIESGLMIVDCPIPVHHYGCLNEVKKQEKAKLYFKLGYDKLDQYKDDLEAIRELAVQAGQLEYWDKAIEMWHYFITLKPDFPEAHVNMAGIHWQIGHYGKALSFARSAISLDPNSKEAHYNVAISLLFMGQSKRAADILEMLVERHQDYTAAHFMLAAALCCNNDLPESLKAFNVCQGILPEQVLTMAVDQLVDKLNENNQKDGARQFKKLAGSALSFSE